MPTTRPRHFITETDQVAQALVAAALRWPDDAHSRTKLLVRLVEEGRQAVEGQREHAAKSHRDTVTRTAGALTGIYGPNYLTDLRGDWPD